MGAGSAGGGAMLGTIGTNGVGAPVARFGTGGENGEPPGAGSASGAPAVGSPGDGRDTGAGGLAGCVDAPSVPRKRGAPVAGGAASAGRGSPHSPQ